VTPSKEIFDRGDTVKFDISNDFDLPDSYIEIFSPDDILWWITDDFTVDVWVQPDVLYTIPYYRQTANENPMELASDAPMGTWIYHFYDTADDELMNGTFEVGPSTAAQVDALLEEVRTDISGLADDVSDLGGEFDTLSDEIGGVSSDVDSLSDNMGDLADDIAAATAAANSASDAVDDLEGALGDLENSVGDIADTANDAHCRKCGRGREQRCEWFDYFGVRCHRRLVDSCPCGNRLSNADQSKNSGLISRSYPFLFYLATIVGTRSNLVV
jgi:hypothetical protein